MPSDLLRPASGFADLAIGSVCFMAASPRHPSLCERVTVDTVRAALAGVEVLVEVWSAAELAGGPKVGVRGVVAVSVQGVDEQTWRASYETVYAALRDKQRTEGWGFLPVDDEDWASPIWVMDAWLSWPGDEPRPWDDPGPGSVNLRMESTPRRRHKLVARLLRRRAH